MAPHKKIVGLSFRSDASGARLMFDLKVKLDAVCQHTRDVVVTIFLHATSSKSVTFFKIVQKFKIPTQKEA